MLEKCIVVTREVRDGLGIVETEHAFSTVEELFGFCVGHERHRLVDRVLITGADAGGRGRLVTFVFQSVSDPALNESE